jgi:hypothetical protein
MKISNDEVEQVNEALEQVISVSFDEFMETYELDPKMSFEDILYEVFSAGFEDGIELEAEEDYDEEED